MKDEQRKGEVPIGAGTVFDPLRNELRIGGRVVRLRRQTGAVLTYLLHHRDRIVSKDELLSAVWRGTVVTENSLAQCIAEIRRELRPAGCAALETVPRLGYCLHSIPQPVPEPAALPREAAADPGLTAQRARGGRRYLAFGSALFLAALFLAALPFWWPAPSRGLAAPSAPLSMAILPLAVKGEDSARSEFATALREDLARDLGQIPGLQMAAGSATADYRSGVTNPRQVGLDLGLRYVVEGAIDGEPGRFVVDLRLVEANTGAQRWSDRIEMHTGLLDVDPRDLNGRLSQFVKAAVIEAEVARLRHAAPASVDADTLALRAWLLWHRASPEDNAQAQVLAREAIALDPESLHAWTVLAGAMLLDRLAGWSEDSDGTLQRAEIAVRRAFTLNPQQPQVNALAGAIMAVRGRYAEAMASFDAELALGYRHDPEVHEWRGITHMLMGAPAHALPSLETAIWLSPGGPRLSQLWRSVALAHMQSGNLCHARDRAWIAVRSPRPSPRAYETLAAICTLYGDPDCAQEAVAELLRLEPGYSIARAEQDLYSTRPRVLANRERYLEALRTAGLR